MSHNISTHNSKVSVNINPADLNIFTDGSALSNSTTSPGGAACFVLNCKLLASTSMYGTNNICELNAIKHTLKMINLKFNIYRTIFSSNVVNIYTDSQYCIGVITGTYKAKANLELIQDIKQEHQKVINKGLIINYIHVRAHTKGSDLISLCNSIVDGAANNAAIDLKHSGDVKKWHKRKVADDVLSKVDMLMGGC